MWPFNLKHLLFEIQSLLPLRNLGISRPPSIKKNLLLLRSE